MAITDNETTTTTPTNGGRITDEVRRDIDVCTQSGATFDTVFIVKSALLCDLDRIDAAHEEAIASVMNDALYHANDKDMADLGWYQALDADKQPIKFGDEVEWRNPCGSCELRHGIVTGIKTDNVDGELFHEVIVNVNGFTVRLMASVLHHYHAPEPDTWERIIRDAVMRGADIQWRAEGGGRMTDYFVPEGYDLVDRCKALAGDES